MIRKALSISLVLVLCLSTLFAIPVMADDNSSFSLSLNNTTPVIGTTVKATVTGNQLTDLYAYEMNFTFDSSRLKFENAEYGNTGFSISPKVQGNSIQLAHTLTGDKPGQSGQAMLVTLTFTTIAEGAATVGLTDMKLVNSKLESVQITSSETVTATITSGSGGGGDGGGGGGGGGGTPPDENPPTGGGGSPGTTPPPDNSSNSKPIYSGDKVTVNATAKLNSGSTTANSVIEEAVWDEILAKVKQANSPIKKIEIIVPDVDDATAYVQQLPSELFMDAASYTITIKTSVSVITLRSDMFTGTDLANGELSLYIGQVSKSTLETKLSQQIGDHPVIDVHFQLNGKPLAWSNVDAPITVSIPYKPTVQELQDPEHIVIWYLTGDGSHNPVVNGKYDAATGMVTFTTIHLSTYAIAFVKKSFDDIATLDWAKEPIELLASKGIISGVSDRLFKPNALITRADFVALLVRTLELQSAQPVSRFVDVKQGDSQDEALLIAKSLGIAKGGSDNRFRPKDAITREEMMSLVVRALQVAKKPLAPASATTALSGFKDVSAISKYALNDVAALVQADLVHGSDNAIHPKANTTRAESAVLMYNLYLYVYSK